MKCISSILLSSGLLIVAVGTPATLAAPVAARFVDDSRCDAISDQLLSREIGDANFFTPIDSITYHDHRANAPVGVPDDGIANDWTVHMTNTSGRSWTNLFFVADKGATIGNADGTIEDQLGAPGVFCDAFRIDATGTNANLLEESIADDGVCQPGEEWEFAITNFGTGPNSLAPEIITPGTFAGSSNLGTFPGTTNGSIVGNPVPLLEPSVIGMIGFIAASLLARRSRKISHR